ncbi:Hypothetical predicted protein [Octopus vulgaris]|uniref:Uncharacterized protein n=1 Tax=Octopus vulgaris TaxID=6645 RepID=A0AA36FGC1_OCTVU|nr:Hypothetical predicted protein [Octopus vulgaris]
MGKLVNVKLSEDNFDVSDKRILMPCEKYYKFEKEIAEISYVKSFLLPEIPSSEIEVEELENLKEIVTPEKLYLIEYLQLVLIFQINPIIKF